MLYVQPMSLSLFLFRFTYFTYLGLLLCAYMKPQKQRKLS